MSDLDVGIVPDYESVAGSAGSHLATFRGWLIHGRGGRVHFDGPGDDVYSNLTFGSSDDIRDAFGRNAEYRKDDLTNARFELTTSCFTGCALVVDDGGNRFARISLDAETNDFHAPGILYHRDTYESEPPLIVTDSGKDAILDSIATSYRQVVPFGMVLLVLIGLARGFRVVRGRRSSRSFVVWALLGGIFLAIVGHCLMLGFVCAVSFNALIPEYEVSLGALFALFVALGAATEGHVLVRFARSKLPAPKRLSEVTG